MCSSREHLSTTGAHPPNAFRQSHVEAKRFRGPTNYCCGFACSEGGTSGSAGSIIPAAGDCSVWIPDGRRITWRSMDAGSIARHRRRWSQTPARWATREITAADQRRALAPGVRYLPVAHQVAQRFALIARLSGSALERFAENNDPETKSLPGKQRPIAKRKRAR